MEIPLPEPEKLLRHWMEWEQGEMSPGTLMKHLKKGGLRQILETAAEGTEVCSFES